MGTQGKTMMTITDMVANFTDKKAIETVEMLKQYNGITLDMLMKEGNLRNGEQTAIRTGLPPIYWSRYNEGVPSGKSTKAKIVEGLGKMEGWSVMAEDVANFEGVANAPFVRADEAESYVEAMEQAAATALFYGNSTIAPEEINGLSVRYSDLSAANSKNIISAGGSGSDNSSIWLLCHAKSTVFCIYARGEQAGLRHEDFGLETRVESGKNLRVYSERWIWSLGLVVKDWRYIVRIPNIDVSNLVSGAGAADLIKLMGHAITRIPSLRIGRPTFYMNRTVKGYLEDQRTDKVVSGGGITYRNVDGEEVAFFRQIPLKTCDALTTAEDTVS